MTQFSRYLAAAAPEQRVRLALGAALVAIFAAGWLLNGSALLNDPDTLWHIAVGRDIVNTGVFPTTDIYSHTYAGSPWFAKEWLSQVVLYTAYSLGGWSAVILFTAMILSIVLAQVYTLLSARLRPTIAVAAAALAMALSSQVFLARPHILALPLIVLFTTGVWRAAEEERAPPFWLLAVLCLWANMHGSFTFGFAAAFFAALSYLFRTRDFRSMRAMRWAAFLALCPAAAMIHPYGVKALMATAAVANSEGLAYIQEWRAFSWAKDWTLALVLAGLGALALVFRFRPHIVTALFCVLMAYMFVSHIRLLYLFFLLAPVLLARDLAAQFPGLAAGQGGAADDQSALDRFFARRAGAVTGFSAVSVVSVATLCAATLNWAPPPSVYPKQAIVAAKAAGVSGNALNDYNFGGALIFEGVPTFVDGRADWLFQNGFFAAIEAAAKDESGAELVRQVAHYDIGWSLLKPEDPRAAMFERMEGWRRVYEDAHAVVHAVEK